MLFRTSFPLEQAVLLIVVVVLVVTTTTTVVNGQADNEDKICSPSPSDPNCGQDSVARLPVENNNEATGDYCVTNGGTENKAGLQSSMAGDPGKNYCVVGGGHDNEARAPYSAIGGGRENKITDFNGSHTVVTGGNQCGTVPSADVPGDASVTYCVVTGGSFNILNTILRGSEKIGMTISGGEFNTVAEDFATITGGTRNNAFGKYSSIMGGNSNLASGEYSTVVGGFENEAVGKRSIAMGSKAKAEHDSSMAINLMAGTTMTTTEPGQFLASASKFRFQVTNDPGSNNENVITMTASNIGNLIAAINSQ